MSRFTHDLFSGPLDRCLSVISECSNLLGSTHSFPSFQQTLSKNGNISKAGLDSLTRDIIVQHVCAYLAVEDIVRLRAVSVRYYNFSHDTYIWKRFLRLLDIKLPPLPPRPQHHDFKMLRSADIEQMIIRTVSFDSNWRSPQPVSFGFDSFPMNIHIVEMVALPGGKHIIASAVNLAIERHYLVVYAVDHRVQGMFPVACMSISALATHVRAQYMRLPDGLDNGHEDDGVAIAYVYHEVGIAEQLNNTAESDVYTCACQFVKLEDLEPLEDPMSIPADDLIYAQALSQDHPFECLAEIKSAFELGPVDICTLLSCRYIAVVCKPSSIIIQDLCHGTEQGRLIIEDFGLMEQNTLHARPPTISHIRVLSDESILVVGTYDDITPTDGSSKPPKFLFVATYELFVPPGMEVTRPYLQQCPYHSNEDLQDIVISDSHVPIAHASAEHGKKARPPCISVFFRDLKHENDLIEIRLNPNPAYLAKELAYDLENTRVGVYRHAFAFPTVPEKERKRFRLKAIAGHRHVLLMMTLDGMLPFYNFYSLIPLPPGKPTTLDEREPDSEDVDTAGTQITRVFEKPSRGISLAKLEIPRDVRKLLQRHGVGAYAWDDHTGRLFFNVPSETNVYTLDLAQCNFRDFEGHPLARKLDVLPSHESYPPVGDVDDYPLDLCPIQM